MHESAPTPPTYAPSLISRTGFGYFPLALVARLPFAMMVVGVLTLVVAARDSMQLGGIVSATVGVGSAIFGPFVGAAADRFGQRPVILATAAAYGSALVALAAVAYSPAPDWVMLAIAFALGAVSPQPSSMSRSRLVVIIQNFIAPERRGRLISRVLAYESAVDEVIFVFGPVLVGVLAMLFGAATPIYAAAGLTIVFVTMFALHRTSAPPKSQEERAETLAPASELARPALLAVILGIGGVGMVFGATLTSLTAFMQGLGAPEAAGLFYGIMGIGSAVLAIAVSFFSPRFSLRYRWIVFAALVVAGCAIIAIADSTGAIALGLAVTGTGIGPLLVTLFTLGAIRSPEGRSATVMTMLGSGIVLGQSLAGAVSGALAENAGIGASLGLCFFAALVPFAAGLVNWILTPPKSSRSA